MTGARASRVRVNLILMLFVLSAIAFLDRTNISVAGVQMRQEFGIDQIQLGWVFSAFLLGYATFQVPAGWLASRYGPRLTLTVGVIWWGVFTVLTIAVSPALGSVVMQLIMLRAVLGMGEAIVYPAGNQFLSRWIPVQERGKANGWIFAGVGAGAGLAPPLVTAIIAVGGWRLSFIVCAILGLIACYFWYRMARDRPEDHPAVSEQELAHIKAGLPALAKERPTTPWGAIFSSKEVWGLFVSYSTFGYIVWLYFSWFFIYLAEARQIDLKSSALYSMLPFMAMTVFCLTGGWLNDRIARKFGLFWGRSGLSIVAFLLTAGFLMFGSQAASVPLAVAALAGGAGALYLAQSSFWSVTADISGPHTGVVSGFMNMGCQFSGAISASLTPWIATNYGWIAAFGTAAGLAMVGAAAWTLVNPTVPIVREAKIAMPADKAAVA